MIAGTGTDCGLNSGGRAVPTSAPSTWMMMELMELELEETASGFSCCAVVFVVLLLILLSLHWLRLTNRPSQFCIESY